jgi:hypothetical protein
MSEDLSSYKQLKRSINLTTTTASKPSSTTTTTSSTSIKQQISIDSENPFNDYYLIDELEKSSTTTTSSLKTSLKQLKYLLEFGSTSTSTSTNNRNSSSSNNTISSSSNDPTTTSSSIITSNRNSSTSSASTSTSASASSSRQNLAADAAAVAVVDDLSHHGGSSSSRSAYVSQLNELIEFCSSCYDDGDVDARNLVELALVKKLNYLSSAVLGLERRILPSFLLVPPNNASGTATTANNSGTSMLSLNECYARYDRLEADLGPTHLIRVSIDAASLMLLKNLGKIYISRLSSFNLEFYVY